MIKKLKEQRAKILADMDTIITAAAGESRSMSADERADYTTKEARFNELSAEIKILEDHEARAAAAAASHKPTIVPDGGSHDAEARAAFFELMRGRTANVSAEMRAELVGTDGKITIPKVLVAELMKEVSVASDFLLNISIIQPSTGAPISFPTTDSNTQRGMSMAEYAKSEQGKVTFKAVDLVTHTYRTNTIPISNELLQDSAINIEAEVMAILREQIANAINYDATNGDGVSKIKGILRSIEKGAVAAAVDSVAYADLISLMRSLNSTHSNAATAKWMMNTSTQITLMLVRDDSGKPILTDPRVEGEPYRLFGRPIIINNDMPDIGAGKRSITFGNHGLYKLVLPINSMEVARLVELYKENNATGYIAFQRAGGTLVSAGICPVKYLEHPAA